MVISWEELLSIDATLYSNIASPIIMVTSDIKGHNAQFRVGFSSIRERSGSSPNKSDLSQKKIGQIGVIHKLRSQDFGFLTTYPPAFTFLWYERWQKNGHFKTTYLPCLVNVVCEWPQEWNLQNPFLKSRSGGFLVIVSDLFSERKVHP